MGVIEYQDLGLIPYRRAWELQEELRGERIAGNIPDRILLLEHSPVFTMGKRDCEEDFCSPEEVIRGDGIEIIKSNRGGRVTYHGPGQLVGYFIFNLDEIGVGIKDFVHKIEEICISTLKVFEINSGRDKDHPGIWIGNDKIAAIGLNVTHGVTEHGFAFNVNCDLSAYRHIIACGIKGRGVTSMAMQMSAPPSISRVKEVFLETAEKLFLRKIARAK